MHIFKTAAALNEHLDHLRSQQKRIGFVPTMGALHRGHMALIEHSAGDNDETVVSIFVNPTQFNNPADLQRYPRETAQDLIKLQSTPCNVVFLPSVEEVYPNEVASENIQLGSLDQSMEGAHRPGHFAGVATVVKRLFELVKPNRAYFGEKDYQQLSIIRHVARAQNLAVEIHAHPTERNDSGLALSSRNQLLSPEEQQQALAIYRNLHWASQNYAKQSPQNLKNHIEANFLKEPLVLEYVEIADEKSLRPIQSWSEAEHARIFIAASLSGVRLIDNVSLF